MEVNTNYRSNLNERSGVFFLIGLMGVSFVIGGILTMGLWKMMTGQSMMEMQTSMLDPTFAKEIRITQTFLAFFIFFLPAVFAVLIFYKKPFEYLGFAQKSSLKSYAIVLPIMAVGMVLSGSLATVSDMIPLSEGLKATFKGMEDAYMKQVEAMSQMKGIGDLFITIIVMAFAPAVFEEVFFRAGLQKMMIKVTGKVILSVIITSIIFSAIHFSFYGFLSRTALGIILGLLYAYSGNIWLSILAHFLNNAFAVVEVYVLRQQGKSLESSIEDKLPAWLCIVAIVGLVYLVKKFRETVKERVF